MNLNAWFPSQGNWLSIYPYMYVYIYIHTCIYISLSLKFTLGNYNEAAVQSTFQRMLSKQRKSAPISLLEILWTSGRHLRMDCAVSYSRGLSAKTRTSFLLRSTETFHCQDKTWAGRRRCISGLVSCFSGSVQLLMFQGDRNLPNQDTKFVGKLLSEFQYHAGT